MPGRFLLIEFDDNGIGYEAVKEAANSYYGIRIVGLFIRPDTFCQCGDWVTIEGKTQAKSMLLDTGERLCLKCMKPWPTMDWLRNMLPPERIKEPFNEVVLGRRLSFYARGLSLPSLGTEKFGKD